MFTIIYRLIVAMVLALTVWNLFSDKRTINQINAALVLIPLILRALMVK